MLTTTDDIIAFNKEYDDGLYKYKQILTYKTSNYDKMMSTSKNLIVNHSKPHVVAKTGDFDNEDIDNPGIYILKDSDDFELLNKCSLYKIDNGVFDGKMINENVETYYQRFIKCENDSIVFGDDIKLNENITSLHEMFAGSLIHTINLENLDTSHITDISGMFQDCDIRSIDLSPLDLSRVENAEVLWYHRLDYINFGPFGDNNCLEKPFTLKTYPPVIMEISRKNAVNEYIDKHGCEVLTDFNINGISIDGIRGDNEEILYKRISYNNKDTILYSLIDINDIY